MKTIIAGSRSITTYDDVLDGIYKANWVLKEIVSGTAKGVDRFGERYANYNDIPIKRFPANWEKHGKSAGYKRNVEMAEYADAVIVIWDGKSKGAKHMIDIALSHKLLTLVYIPNKKVQV